MGDFVVRALNEAYNVNSLSETQTQGLITCIPKGNKPKEYLKNWRPITLLNTVYRIGTGCIANRIKSFLPKLIHTDQSGFIKDRYIAENLRLIYDLLHYTEANNIPEILLLIDFEKAFDSLSWSFINKTLKTFRFGPSVKRWFNIFYQDAKSAVSQCGYLFFKSYYFLNFSKLKEDVFKETLCPATFSFYVPKFYLLTSEITNI